MIDKLTNYASIIGVIGAIGGGFYAWGEFNTRLSGIENKEFIVNETVDLGPINDKIAALEVEILDRMSALEDEWMDRDNNSMDNILNDITGIKNTVDNNKDKSNENDQQLQKNITELSSDIFKEFGKVRDLIKELETKIAITDKQTQLNGILIEEIQEKSSNPLSN